MIPASHFALHLVFIFQAIKPAARRWREYVCVSINTQIECVCVPALTNTWVCRLSTLTGSYITKVSAHMCEDKLMNLQTRVHRAAGLIRNTGMEPE